MSTLETAIDGIVRAALERMVRDTADETMRGLGYETKDLLKVHIAKEVARLFTEDAEIKNALRDVVLRAITSYRVPVGDARANSRI